MKNQRHLGDKKTNIEGEKSIVASYTDPDHMTVIFKVDNSPKETTLKKWKAGLCFRDKNATLKNKLKNKIFTDRRGDQAVVISVESDDTATLRYIDGEILSGVPVDALEVSLFDRKEELYTSEDKGLEAERLLTFDNARYLLNRYHRCMCVRPTGFGKTYMALKFMKMPKYQKILYLYINKDMRKQLPIEDIMNREKGKIIDVQTYQWILRKSPSTIAAMDYDLVVLDEADCTGGDEEGNGAYKTYKAILNLINSHPHTHFFGITATPYRRDGIDVIKKIFLNHTCYPYTYADAMDDGVMLRPNYYYQDCEAKKRIKDLNNKFIDSHVTLTREELEEMAHITAEVLQELDARNLPTNIKELCDKHIPNTNYMKFIVFFPTYKELNEGLEEVNSWFKKAYPNYEIVSTIVTAATDNNMKTVDNLPTTPSEGFEGRIDLVFNCEILCRGYHDDTISALIIKRRTTSMAKYIQILGRMLSCSAKHPALIIDIVDNIHAKFLTPKEEEAPEVILPVVITKPQTYAEIEKKYPYGIDWDTITRNNRRVRESERIVNQTAKTSEKVTPHKKLDPSSLDEVWEKKVADTLKPYIGEKSSLVKAEEAVQNLLDDEGIFYSPIEYGSEEKTKPVKRSSKKAEKEDLGYASGTYLYDFASGELLSKNVVYVNKYADVTKLFKDIDNKQKERIYNEIITEYKETGCVGSQELYESYAEINVQTSSYAILNAICENHKIDINNILKRMITGTVW